jgi:nucleotide-binding universal stress UspA family protein
VFTRLLVGVDGSPSAQAALEQALVLARRFRASIVIAGVREPGGRGPDRNVLDAAWRQVEQAGFSVEVATPSGEPATALVKLANDADAVLLGRRGTVAPAGALGSTAVGLVRTAPVCALVAAAAPSPMRTVALAFDGGETSLRALEMAAQFASVVGSTVHVIHANDDHEAGLRIVGAAEATLSLRESDFSIHIEPGSPGAAVARIVRSAGCDSLFAGAHVAGAPLRRPLKARPSHAEDILQHTDVPVAIQP